MAHCFAIGAVVWFLLAQAGFLFVAWARSSWSLKIKFFGRLLPGVEEKVLSTPAGGFQ